MPYIVTRSDPTQPPITVPDGSINVVDTSVTLVGRNYPNYGQALADNFVHMVENFSSPTAPGSAITGQVWYDSTDTELLGIKRVGKLKVYDGIQWRSINNVYTSTNIVAQNEIGDIWVEAYSTTATIKVYDGTNWQIPVFQFSATTITSLPTLTTATDASKLMVSQSGALYGITKENFFSDRVTTGMTMIWSATTSTVPSGWLLCDGSSLLKASYADLFGVLGSRYNTTATSSLNFNLPNLVGPNSTQGNITTTYYIIKT